MEMAPAWTFGDAVRAFAMWAVMMAAMMLPAVARTAVLTTRPRRGGETAGARAAIVFASGALSVWTGVGAVATLAQWELDRLGALSPVMSVRSPILVGLILAGVGLYQFTPVKEACLRRCRAPRAYLAPPYLGAGLRYGVASLGACGLLMGLIFIGGVMNVVWSAGLALLMYAEQAAPWTRSANWGTGAALIVWGSVALAGGIG